MYWTLDEWLWYYLSKSMCLLFCHCCWLTWKFEYPVVWLQPCLFTQNIEYKRHGSRCQVHLVRGNYRWGWSSAGMNKVLQKMNQELRQCTNIKSNSSGGGPHRPWRNVDSERGQVHLGSASVYWPPSSSTLHWSYNSSSRPSRPSPSPARLRLVGLGLGGLE